MKARAVVVLDVGKTNSKLTLWSEEGECLGRVTRTNDRPSGGLYPILDRGGIETWLMETLREFSAMAHVIALVPVSHGAAAALVCEGALFTPPMDYEVDIPEAAALAYEVQRDEFSLTGSPRLPQGLNLGAQLHYLEELTGPWPPDLRILTWPQYWAWLLCGVAASEVSSLGCHTDLWRPLARCASPLALRRGWSDRLPALRHAGEPLGRITQEWVEATRLPSDCLVYCGLHDSNAALLAARGHEEIATHDATILSTGTWFVAMRSPGSSVRGGTAAAVIEGRDSLINVDVDGRVVPSARFMGGRETERVAGCDMFNLTRGNDPRALHEPLPRLLRDDVQVLPNFAPGFGPFPQRRGEWVNEPADPRERRVALELYLALMSNVALDLIGSRDRIVVEGRFGDAESFVRGLASLRRTAQVYISNAVDDLPYGALRLVWPRLPPRSMLMPVKPLDLSLEHYAARWHERAFEAAGGTRGQFACP
jgi:sugar (pentulose or hexulose) kinase